MSGELDELEATHTSLLYFLETLELMTLSSGELQVTVGGNHVVWELVNDALDLGRAAIGPAQGPVSSMERDKVNEFLEVLSDVDPNAAGFDDSQQWARLRADARSLLCELTPLKARNRRFLESKT